MINNENRQSFTNLFNKFIRMTIKTDNQDKRFKKRNISIRSSKENENLSINPSSTHDYYQVSLISNENNNTYSYNDDNDQQDNYSDQVRKFYFLY